MSMTVQRECASLRPRFLIPVWRCQQIEAGDFENNDYVYFHLKKENGTFLQVLDHGRIVENGRYGRVFYVLLMDWNSIKKHYENPF